jgi:hypothetical protein
LQEIKASKGVKNRLLDLPMDSFVFNELQVCPGTPPFGAHKQGTPPFLPLHFMNLFFKIKRFSKKTGAAIEFCGTTFFEKKLLFPGEGG